MKRKGPIAVDEYDYIIVGAGSAGCVIARRLIEQTDARVLMVEAGPVYPGCFLNPPLPGMKIGRRYTWNQKSVPQPRLMNRQITWPMGKVVGGTSSINAMMAYLGHPSDFDSWEKAGNPGWSATDLAPYFQRVFGCEPLSSTLSTDYGILKLSDPRFHSDFSEAFLAACQEDGMQREHPLRGHRGECCGYYPVLQRNGERFESARGYLQPTLKNKRLFLKTAVNVRRLLIEKNRSIGIETWSQGRGKQFHAKCGVILCAGVFQTPRILQCSGIGPAEMLTQAGIRVLLDSPAVGANFQDHVRVGMRYRTSRISPGNKRRWIPETLRYLWRRDGVMASNCCETGAFICSSNDVSRPDIQLITHFQTFESKFEVDIEICLVRPQSRGRISLSSQNPYGLPLVDPNYLDEENDVQSLIKGIERVRSIASRKSLVNYPLLYESSPGTSIADPSGLRRAIYRLATTAYHPVGTCAMGPNGVIDSQLRVRSIEGLWVADASAIPTAPSGNSVCAVLALAEKASDLIIGVRK